MTSESPHVDPRRSRRTRSPLAFALALSSALAVSLAGCTDFETFPSSTCGNGVVEGDREDCDLATPNPAICSPPGTPNACRFVCSSTRACPVGSTCVQATGTCVRETASFGDAVRVADGVNATNVELTDTDGDGSFETFVSYNGDGEATRFFFEIPKDRSMSAVTPRRIPEWPVPPRSTRSLEDPDSGSKRAGILAPIATGLTMLHRDQGGSLQPDARFGAISIDGIAGNLLEKMTHSNGLNRKLGRKGIVRDGIAFASDTPAGVVVAAGWQAADPADSSPCTARGGFARRVDGESANIVYFGGANIVEASPCDELTVIFTNGDGAHGNAQARARFFDSCDANACPTPNTAIETSMVLTPPEGRTAVLTEATAADIDGDGHVDLVAAWRLGSEETSDARKKTFTIHIGLGNGTFLPAIAFAVELLNTQQELMESATGLTTFRERRDRDGVESARTFAVISDRVLRFDEDLNPPQTGIASIGAFQVSWPTGASRWEAPIPDDLDRDGVLDVVLTNGPRIYVLRGNGFGSFGTTVVEAGAPIRSKAVGDYDGDGLLDVAITRERFSSSAETGDDAVDLLVAYGMGSCRFSAWVPVLSLQNADAKLIARRRPEFTGADALLALRPYTTAGAPPLIELAGDGTQGGLFPASRPVCGNANDAPIEANAATVFHSTVNGVLKPFVFVASKKRPLTNDRQTFEGVAVASVSSNTVDANGFRCTQVLPGKVVLNVAAANFCGDAGDELFLLHRDAGVGATLASVLGDPTTATSVPSFAAVPVASRTAPKDIGNANAESTIADLDGDGDLDVLVRLGDDAGIAWNDTPLASVQCADAVFRFEALSTGTRRVVDADVFDRGAGTPPDVVVLFADAVVRYRRGQGGAFEERADLPITLASEGTGTPTALELADVDGDGFQDAVISDARGVRIHYGVERPRRLP
jgi:FG-GAP-like repeat